MTDSPEIFWTASLAFVSEGRLLVVRKAGTSKFMLPGGKLEAGETPLDCAIREAEEEVGATVAAQDINVLGHWQADAANEPGALVDSVVHVTDHEIQAQPLAEIDAVHWLEIDTPDLPTATLAPLLTDYVLPALRSRVNR